MEPKPNCFNSPCWHLVSWSLKIGNIAFTQLNIVGAIASMEYNVCALEAWCCYSGFHHSRWITLCMAFPCPATDSLDPMDYLLSFDVSLIIPKTIWKMIYTDFYPISAYIRGFDPYNRIHWDVCIIQILLEFSLTWIWLIWLLAFHMPWDRSDSTLHYPLWSYIRNPLVHWRHKR